MLMKHILMLSDRGQTNIFTIYTNWHILSTQERGKNGYLFLAATLMCYIIQGVNCSWSYLLWESLKNCQPP